MSDILQVINEVEMSVPTEEEKLLIIQFREKVNDILENEEQRSDHFLLRWIRARDGMLEKSEEMLRSSQAWRKENDIDNVLKTPVDPFLAENFPYNITVDLEGRPVMEMHMSLWDMRKVINSGKEDEFQHYINVFFETLMSKIRKSNEGRKSEWPITQFVIIADFEGYSYAQILNWKAFQSLLKFASHHEQHYPEVLFRAVAFNCPSIMPLFMKLIKPFLAPKTYGKIKLLGSNKQESYSILRQIVHPDQLSSRMGGNRII